MQALRSQMNPHFLFNCLNSIKSYITQNDKNKALNYLNKFAQLIRLILENSKSHSIRLQQELKALQLYIQLERTRFSNTFDYEIQVGEDVNPDFVEIPPLILQPYVENAIWHGLMHKQNGPGFLKIAIDRHGDLLHFVIEDNGIGRQAAQRIKSRDTSKHRSLGMEITSDRLQANGKPVGPQKLLEVIDLYDEQQEACGTRVIIRLEVPD